MIFFVNVNMSSLYIHTHIYIYKIAMTALMTTATTLNSIFNAKRSKYVVKSLIEPNKRH